MYQLPLQHRGKDELPLLWKKMYKLSLQCREKNEMSIQCRGMYNVSMYMEVMPKPMELYMEEMIMPVEETVVELTIKLTMMSRGLLNQVSNAAIVFPRGPFSKPEKGDLKCVEGKHEDNDQVEACIFPDGLGPCGGN